MHFVNLNYVEIYAEDHNGVLHYFIKRFLASYFANSSEQCSIRKGIFNVNVLSSSTQIAQTICM